jgi:dihydroneopterin aldolase/2-amino-4-hydroxy-6-hydroxymethyldihydropteridine diphosphokinase
VSDVVTVMIRGLEVFGRHGVFAAEQELGQRFIVDVELALLSCPGVTSDALSDTVDYATLSADIVEIVAGPHRQLLEYVAGAIADRALDESYAHRVTVEVRKPHVALPYVLTETAVRLERMRQMTYWLGIGSNLGDRFAHLQGIVDAVRDAGVEIEALSPIYDTAPREITDQPSFLNAALRVRTTKTPREMLAIAKRVERQLGRTGGGVRFGPRPADCDILLWDGGHWGDAHLEIPHPRMQERRFVLVPLCDVAPGATDATGRLLTEVLGGLDPEEQPVNLWPDGELG